MPSFPTLSSGVVAKYPLTRGSKTRTGVATALDFSEQRYAKGVTSLAEFELVFNSVSTADKNAVRNFFNARLGGFDHSWDLTLPDPTVGSPTTYYNLQFVPGQQFEATQTKPFRWSFTLHVRQTNPNNLG